MNQYIINYFRKYTNVNTSIYRSTSDILVIFWPPDGYIRYFIAPSLIFYMVLAICNLKAFLNAVVLR